MAKISRGAQWFWLITGCCLLLFFGSSLISWITSGTASFELRGITYSGAPAAVAIVAFASFGAVLIATSSRNLGLWR